jgi:RNA polymerase sigma-70 factor (ECF subfamily)
MNPEAMSFPLRGVALLRKSLAQATWNKESVRDLTASIRRGDEAAFSRFYDLYSLRLYKYLLVLAKGDEADAREVLQVVVLKLARKMQLFDDEVRLWVWATRLARNAFIDHCRSRKREQRLVSLDELTADLSESEKIETRLSDCLARALESFSPEEAELLRAAYIDELPLQSLADEAGQTYKALESRLGRLRKKLKMTILTQLRHEP